MLELPQQVSPAVRGLLRGPEEFASKTEREIGKAEEDSKRECSQEVGRQEGVQGGDVK